MNKAIETIKTAWSEYTPGLEEEEVSIRLDEMLHWPSIVGHSMDVMPRSRALPGGRLRATFTMAQMGELDYHSDVAYTTLSDNSQEVVEGLDTIAVEMLRQIVRNEVECQVCYALMLDPLTTSCGHTFCRKCVARMLDHSNLCPICRRRLAMAPGAQHEPSNKGLSRMIAGLLKEQLQARRNMDEIDDLADAEAGVPLFPVTLAFPTMPTFLHIFEPRYRLMIRRVMENETRRFGILSYNSTRQTQGDLGIVPFMQYGTMLHVRRVEMFRDGRSLVETMGIYRFKVLEHTMRDGYMVGRVQRLDDLSFAEEEAIEARETSSAEPADNDLDAQLNVTSTQELLQIGLDFIQAARQRSAPWLHERVLAAYGQPPNDAASFPFWFASVLPISEEEKYALLPCVCVRDRLKMTARWIRRLEAARCIHEAALARSALNNRHDAEDEDTDDDDGEIAGQDPQSNPPANESGNAEPTVTTSLENTESATVVEDVTSANPATETTQSESASAPSGATNTSAPSQ